VLRWLLDLAASEAEDRGNAHAAARVRAARHALRRLRRGLAITLLDRADIAFLLRLAGEVVPDFGAGAIAGYEAARAALARLVIGAPLSVETRNARRLSPERVVYWGGKVVATYYGVGGLYDAAYRVVQAETSRGAPRTTVPTQPLRTVRPAPEAATRREETPAATNANPSASSDAPGPLGSLAELHTDNATKDEEELQ
jgi:hypothetical protein